MVGTMILFFILHDWTDLHVMKHLALSVVVFALVISFNGCSKKQEATSSPQPAPESSPSPAAQQTRTATPQPAAAVNVVQLENNVNTALKQQNYDAAVDALVQAQSSVANMSDEQRRQYAQQFRNASEALKNASLTDPKARAAYDRMGRAITGR